MSNLIAASDLESHVDLDISFDGLTRCLVSNDFYNLHIISQ